ncbi:DUF268 domain-containing protein [Ideonella sp. DXS22W]|uniref:DUF268 domain-containing protein n=1 Tax=Pseudaquabacterium inlustre TaxID=2984192 RepID=A0ABU9CAL9_9BURK
MSDKLYIVYCTSGLGNRLRPLAAAMAYCQMTGRRLRVYWDNITPNGCLTPLERLFDTRFEAITLDEIEALGRSELSLALFTEKGPGHNVQREAERFGRDQLLKLAQRTPPRHSQALRLDESADVVIVYDNDYLQSVPRERSIAALRSLVPSAEVRDKVIAQAAELGLWAGPGQPWQSLKGVHARGTDFGLQQAIEQYSQLVRERLGGQRFFLSTEDAQLEQGLREAFPGQVISRNDRLHLALNEGKQVWGDPDSYTISVEHGLDALTDIYLLSCVDLVVFHPGSTFAEISRHLHGVLQADAAASATADALTPEMLNADFVARCTALLPRGAQGHHLPTEGSVAGPAPLETLPRDYLYWETLGWKVPMLERMINTSNGTPTLRWDTRQFERLVAGGDAGLSEAQFRALCPYPEARGQISRLAGHVRGSRVLIIGSETYWLELLCALYGAREVVTVEYREIAWTDGLPAVPTRLRSITWDQYLTELPQHAAGYDMVLSYSSIEHSGLGRYGDRFQPLGDLYTFYLMSRCLAPHGLCGLAVPVGQDLTHFNAHRIYGPTRIQALGRVGGLNLVGLSTPDAEYLAREETEPTLRQGWTLDSLGRLPLGKLRQPLLCFGAPGFSNAGFETGRGRVSGASAPVATAPDQDAAGLAAQAIARAAAQGPVRVGVDPHLVALQATAQAVGGARFVEVTHVRPFGFRELEAQRINLSVDEALAADPAVHAGIEHCVLHVLLGCDVPRERMVAVLRWALARFRHVHVLEHNAASRDWATEAVRTEHCIANCLDEPQLAALAALCSTRVSPIARLPGVQCTARNLLFTLQGLDATVPYDSVPGFYQALGLDAAARGRASFSGWNDVYLGTAEAMSLVARHVQQLRDGRGRWQGRRLVASCGGFFSLDQMVACGDQGFAELVMFDVNPCTVAFSRAVHGLITQSPTRRDFVERYLLAPVDLAADGRMAVSAAEPLTQRLLRAARVGALYEREVFDILRTLAFARVQPQGNGLQVWGMRNVGDNRIDVAARLDIHDAREQFRDSNCLVNGPGSWLASDANYDAVRDFLGRTPVRYQVASIEEVDAGAGDLVLASNIFDFVPPAVRERLAADVL